MRKVLTASSLFLFFISCEQKKSNELKNTYEILSLLTNKYLNTIVLKPSFPPPVDSNNNYSFLTRDSLNTYKRFYQETIREKTVGINPNLMGVKRVFGIDDKCFENKALINSFMELNEVQKINLNRIIVYQNETILGLKEISDNHFNDLTTTDIIIQFSRIAFNNELDKAIIIVNGTYDKLDSVTVLYYLEKKKERWHIKCERGLSIS
jgi:hypothetical protein